MSIEQINTGEILPESGKYDQLVSDHIERKEVVSEGILLECDSEIAGKLSNLFTDEASPEEPLMAVEVTVYNISRVRGGNGEKLVSGRIERRDSQKSVTAIFRVEGNRLVLLDTLPVLPLQDPWHSSTISGAQVIGGVETGEPESDDPYHQVFYIYKDSLLELQETNEDRESHLRAPDIIAPKKMKDVRMIELPNGKIAIFTRPQDIAEDGRDYGNGKIGYLEVDSLEDLKTDRNIMLRAEILDGLFGESEWGGANDLYLLKDNEGKTKIGVLGHIARKMDNGLKDYAAATFIYDPETRKWDDLKVIATADDFPPVPVKSEELHLDKVVFSGGLDFFDDDAGKVGLYVGINDYKAGYIEIINPFTGYTTTQ